MRVATFVQAALHERGIDVTIKSISNAQLFLPRRRRHARERQLRPGLRAVADGRRSRRSAFWRCDGPRELHALVRSARSTRSSARARARPTQARAQAALRANRPDRRARRADHLSVQSEYIYAYRARLHGFAPNAFMPTWNAAEWRVANGPAVCRRRRKAARMLSPIYRAYHLGRPNLDD